MTKRGTSAAILLAAFIFLSFFIALDYFSQTGFNNVTGEAIAGFNYTTNGTAYLETKDQHDRVGFGVSNPVIFFANYSDSSTGDEITTGICTILINDSTNALMTYNTTYAKFVYVHPGFSTEGEYIWNVTCTDATYNSAFTADNISIKDYWLLVDANFTNNTMPLSNGSALLVDYDDDTYPDLFVTGINASGNKHTILYRNNATEFTEAFTFTGVSHSDEIIMDLDNDTYPEIIYCGADVSNNPVTEIQTFDGSSFSAYSSDDLIDVTNCSLATLDFNMDEKTDLLISGYNGTNNEAYLYLNNGTALVKNLSFDAVQTGEIIVYDLNNDTYDDFFVLGSTEDFGGEISDFYFNSNGTNLTSNTTFILNPIKYPEIGVFDVDGDGNNDVLVSGQDNGGNAQITLYLYNVSSQKLEDKTGTAISGLDTSVSRGCVGVGDFNGNGYMDLYISGLQDGASGIRDSNASIYSGDGNTLSYNASLSKGLIYNKYSSCVFGDIDKASSMSDIYTVGSLNGECGGTCYYYASGFVTLQDFGYPTSCSADSECNLAAASFVTGSITASSTTTYPEINTYSSIVADETCGDVILHENSGETCDGTDFGSAGCSDYGYDSGSLSCSASCTIVTSACYNAASSGGSSGGGGSSSSPVIYEREIKILFYYSETEQETRTISYSYERNQLDQAEDAFITAIEGFGVDINEIDYFTYNAEEVKLNDVIYDLNLKNLESSDVIVAFMKKTPLTFEIEETKQEKLSSTVADFFISDLAPINPLIRVTIYILKGDFPEYYHKSRKSNGIFGKLN